eukprot:357362-Chlamydomonas_euryale.AAC.8
MCAEARLDAVCQGTYGMHECLWGGVAVNWGMGEDCACPMDGAYHAYQCGSRAYGKGGKEQ